MGASSTPLGAPASRKSASMISPSSFSSPPTAVASVPGALSRRPLRPAGLRRRGGAGQLPGRAWVELVVMIEGVASAAAAVEEERCQMLIREGEDRFQ